MLQNANSFRANFIPNVFTYDIKSPATQLRSTSRYLSLVLCQILLPIVISLFEANLKQVRLEKCHEILAINLSICSGSYFLNMGVTIIYNEQLVLLNSALFDHSRWNSFQIFQLIHSSVPTLIASF